MMKKWGIWRSLAIVALAFAFLIVTGISTGFVAAVWATEPEMTQATVKIVWDDENNWDGKRPESLNVDLFSNGGYSQNVSLKEGNGWEATVTGLTKTENDLDIDYFWTADELEDYLPTNISKEGTVTTITLSHEKSQTEATIKIVWDDNGDKQGKRPGSLDVGFLNNNTSDATYTLNAGNGWEYKVTDLPKYAQGGTAIPYTWNLEGALEGYYPKVTSIDGTVTTITFTLNPYVSLIPNESDSADALAAKVVKFNGRPWHIIADNSTSPTEGTVTLLAADTSFGTACFVDSSPWSNNYNESTVKVVLDALTASDGDFANVADAIAATDLDSVTGAKLYLLSTDEATALPENVRIINFTGSGCEYGQWWLRSLGSTQNCVNFVRGDTGGLSGNGTGANVQYGVRPALKLDLSKAFFSSDNNTFYLGSQTISASDVSATYGDTNKRISASVTTPETGGTISYAVKNGSESYIDVASDGLLTIKKVPPTDGKAYVTVTAAETNTHAPATKDVAVTISKAALTITAKDQTYVYNGHQQGEGDPAYDNPAVIKTKVTVSELQGGDYISSLVLTGSATDIGEYPDVIKITSCGISNENGDTVTDNYKITKVEGKLTIEAAPQSTGLTSAQKVANEINSLPDPVTLADKDQVASVKKDFDALPESQQKQVPANLVQKLNKAVDTIAVLLVSDQITQLPDPLTLDDAAAVDAAVEAYLALTDSQKADFSEMDLQKLVEAETAIGTLRAAAITVKMGKVKNLKGGKVRVPLGNPHYNAVKGKAASVFTAQEDTGISGFYIQYSTDKKFKKKVRTKKIKDPAARTLTVKKLKKGKTYYFRACTYTKVTNRISSKTVTVKGKWSAKKKVKITK